MSFRRSGTAILVACFAAFGTVAASKPNAAPVVRLDGFVVRRVGSAFRVSEVIDWKTPPADATWVPEFADATRLRVLGKGAGRVVGRGVIASPGRPTLQLTFRLPVDGAGVAASRAWPFAVDQTAMLIGSGVDFPVILNQRFYGHGADGGYQVYVTERPIPANTNLILNFERAVGGGGAPLRRTVNPNAALLAGYAVPLAGLGGWLLKRRIAARRRLPGHSAR